MNKIAQLVRKLWLRIACAFAMVRARAHSRARLAAHPPRRILMLCYGNIYRSAFAATSLSARLQASGDACEVRCAGFHPVEGRLSPEAFVALAREYGVELEAHRSRVVSADDVRWADTIVIMDRFNWGRLAAYGKEAQEKI